MVIFLLNLLSVCFELLIYYFFFRYFLGKARFSIVGMIFCYLLAGLTSLYLSVELPEGILHSFCYLAVPVGLALCYKGQLFIRLFIPFLFQVISIMVETSYALLLTSLCISLQVYGDRGFYFYYFTGIVLSNLTIILLLRLFCSWKDYMFIKEQDISFPLYLGTLFFFPLAMLFLINQFSAVIAATGKITVVTLLPMFFLVIISVAFFFLFDFLLHAMQNRQQLELLHKQLEQEQQYHIILLEKHQQFQALRHDIKEKYNNLAGLMKNGYYHEALEYAQQQSDQLAQTSVIQTGLPLLDTILTIKESQAKQIGCQFHSYVSANLDIVGFAVDDLGSLCSNLLNNALEAVQQIEPQEQRQIWCQLVQNKGYLYIIVRNTTAGPVCVHNNAITTTKASKTLHGLGMTIVKNIVSQYEGSYSFVWEDNVFSAKIILPTTEGV